MSDGVPTEQSPLFITNDGEPAYGVKAIFNDQRIQVTIKTATYGHKVGLPHLSVYFNPNKFAHPYEGTTSTSEMRSQILSVNDDLERIGIRADFENMGIDRFDLMRQNEFQDPFHDHMPILQTLTGRRVRKTTNEHSYTLENTQRQAQFYDKGREQGLEDRPNFMRCELRSLENRSVNRVFEIDTVSDLLKTNLDNLHEAYKTHLRESVFTRHTNPNQIIDTQNAIEMSNRKLEYFIATYGNSGVSRFLWTMDAVAIVEIYGSVGLFCEYLKTVGGVSRQASSQWKKKMETALSQHRAFLNRHESKTARLYDNLYSFAI
jgi:hypothetical protein